MGCVTEITTVHEVGWRIRLLVPQIKWSEQNAAALEHALLHLEGVYHLHTSVHSGTVVVYYNPRRLARDLLFETVHHCLFPQSEEDKPKTPPPVRIKKRDSTKVKRFTLSRSWLLFDLLKHGVLAGGSGSAGSALPLALVAVLAWGVLTGRGHHKDKGMG